MQTRADGQPAQPKLFLAFLPPEILFTMAIRIPNTRNPPGAIVIMEMLFSSRMGIEIPILADNNISIMTMAPGGFLVFGILIAIVNKISGGKNAKKSFGCAGCPSAEVCNKAACGEKEEAK